MSKTTSDGSTASYYELPKGCTELQDLISYRNLNAQDGEIFRAIYRKGRASHSDELRDAKKVLFYAKAEVKRLEALTAMPADFGQQHVVEWPADETRADLIGQNGNDGEHYAELEAKRKRWEGAPDGATHYGRENEDWIEGWYKIVGRDIYVWIEGGWLDNCEIAEDAEYFASLEPRP